VVVQKPLSAAYVAVSQLIYSTVIASLLLVALSGALALIAAGRFSAPFTRLAKTTHEIAEGKFGNRVEVHGPGREVVELAADFNRMSGHVQSYVEQLEAAARANRELFIGSIRAFAAAVDAKDPYTRGHSERVAFYSMLVAKHMGMSADEVEKVHLSGIIHDVGKIGIEDRILRKPAALTDEEYEIMKQHPRKGEHILDAVPLLKEMAGAGLMHHENWDGSGYPDGKKGEEIPLLGRIVSVADAFDAMTTDRPYSKAMTFEVALSRLRFLAGKKFDAGCVDAIEKAAAAGDLTPAKAKRASVAARQAGEAVAS